MKQGGYTVTDNTVIENRISRAYHESPMFLKDGDYSQHQYAWLASMGMLDTLRLMGVTVKCIHGSMR